MIGNGYDSGYGYENFSFMMKFSLPLAFLAAFFFASCAEEPPPPTTQQHRAAAYAATQPQQYPPQQPFNPNGPVQQPMATPPPQVAPTPPPTAAPQTKVAKGDYPYGIPVPGKPHLVESPYSPGKYIDVEGFPPGTEVKDPYTDKIFLVP
jgi:outer membrane biosynthesis protein TonB